MRFIFPLWQFLLLAVLLPQSGAAEPLAADDVRFRVQLIWGTSGLKPKHEPDLKKLEGELQKKLAGIFKWKNYFQVSQKAIEVPVGKKEKLRMSKHCVITVENFGDSVVEVNLFGDGKELLKKKQFVSKGEPVVIGGDDKNNTAWFVVLTPGVEKEPEEKKAEMERPGSSDGKKRSERKTSGS